MGMLKLSLLLHILGVAAAVLDTTTPLESLYEIRISSENGACLPASARAICSQLPQIVGEYKQCELTNAAGCHQLNFLISFNSYYNESFVHSLISGEVQVSSWATSVDQLQVEDVNECTDGRTVCSNQAICRNSRGAYRCQCMVGYVQPDSITSAQGTYCVESCDFVTCFNDGICNVAVDEESSATCRCPSGNGGLHCEVSLDTWKVILIGVSAGIAALVGLVLFIYAMTRLLRYRSQSPGDDDDVRSQLSEHKPRIFGDTSRFADFGSYSRANSGYQDVGNDSRDGRSVLTRNDGLILGRQPWDAYSDISDPTPALQPAYQGPYMVRGKATGQLELPSPASGYMNSVQIQAESVTSNPDYFA